MEFSKSQRGNTVLTHLGFEYSRFRENKATGVISWRCRQYKSSSCKGYIKTNGDDIIGDPSPHSHDACPHKAKANIAMSKMKESIKHAGATASSVIGNETIGLNSDILAYLPKRASIARSLSRHKKVGQLPSTDTPDFSIPEMYVQPILHVSVKDDPDRSEEVDSMQALDKNIEDDTFDKVLEFSKSQRGNAVLTYLGYEYNKFRENKATGVMTWRCRRHKSSSCRATIKTNRDSVVGASSSHSHASYPQKARANIALSKMKEGIKQAGATARSVIGNEIIGLNSDILAHLPKQSSITRNLLRHKKGRISDPYARLMYHDSGEDDRNSILAIEYH